MSPLVGFRREGYSKLMKGLLFIVLLVESPWILWLGQLSDVSPSGVLLNRSWGWG